MLFIVILSTCQSNSEKEKLSTPNNTSESDIKIKKEILVKDDIQEEVAVEDVYILHTLIPFDSIVSIDLTNDKGFHQISKEDWNSIVPILKRAIFINGLLCPPGPLAITFNFMDGTNLTGSFCSGHLNFSNNERLFGSFRLDKVIDLQAL